MPFGSRNGGVHPNDGKRDRVFEGKFGSKWLPDVQRILKQGWKQLPVRPDVPGWSEAAIAGVIALAALWLATGIYVVNPDEQGVVLRFGAISTDAPPGLHYHLPWPIEAVEIVPVTRENQLDIGYRRGGSESIRYVPEESLSLTGDENIVDIDFTVFWVIKSATDFLFNVENPQDRPDAMIRAVAESAMREVIGKSEIEPLLTIGRASVQNETRALMQSILDSYGAGVAITRIQMQKVDPPAQVLASYRDVQAARTDQDRMRNQAEAYANKVVPEARGGAARIVWQAEGYKQQVTQEAEGEAQRFLAIDEQYKKAPEVTRTRIYIDTMQSIFAETNNVIIGNTGSGVRPYLPLPQLRQGTPRAVPPSPSPVVPAPPIADARSGRN